MATPKSLSAKELAYRAAFAALDAAKRLPSETPAQHRKAHDAYVKALWQLDDAGGRPRRTFVCYCHKNG